MAKTHYAKPTMDTTPTLPQGDPSIVRVAFTEEYREHKVEAMTSRFGSLAVFVWEGEDYLYQGDNILAARAWIDARVAKRKAR